MELVIPIEKLGDMFESNQLDTGEFDQVAWEQFFVTHEKFRTLCLDCIALRKERARLAALRGEQVSESDEDKPEKFGPVFLQPRAREMVCPL